MVGVQDDQVFDGGSFVLNPYGELAVQLPRLDETLVHVDFFRDENGWRAEPGDRAVHPDEWEQDYRVTVTGLRDYMRKSGFGEALLGLSGGVDSALVAAIAADALGPENVRCVMLPSEFTSQASLDDASAVARARLPAGGGRHRLAVRGGTAGSGPALLRPQARVLSGEWWKFAAGDLRCGKGYVIMRRDQWAWR